MADWSLLWMTSQQSVFVDHCLTPNNLAQQTAIIIQYTNFIVQVQCTCMCFVQQVVYYTIYNMCMCMCT